MSRLLQLGEAVTSGAIETVRFFNGRLLSGADLTREQTARGNYDARLAQAIGSGIAYGLTVAQTATDRSEPLAAVTVSAGLGVTRSGQVLALASDTRIALVRSDSSDFSSSQPCSFDNCTPVIPGSYVAGEGLYLLVAAPAAVPAGRAQVNGLQGDPLACNVDRDLGAVCFRLIEVPPHSYQNISAAAPDFRNRIAYRCFGERAALPWVAQLYGQADSGTTLLGALAGSGLGSDDLPLALIHFTGALDVTFVDQWAVRRSIAPADQTDPLSSMTQPARIATGTAMLQQFQDQLAGLTGPDGSLGPITAQSHFPTLPPLGLLPGLDADAAHSFLGTITWRGPVHINAAQLEVLIRESLSAPAINSSDGSVVWLYAVAENLIEAARRTANPVRPKPYLVFARGDLAYRSDARFNLHRWNYANFALGSS